MGRLMVTREIQERRRPVVDLAVRGTKEHRAIVFVELKRCRLTRGDGRQGDAAGQRLRKLGEQVAARDAAERVAKEYPVMKRGRPEIRRLVVRAAGREGVRQQVVHVLLNGDVEPVGGLVHFAVAAPAP